MVTLGQEKEEEEEEIEEAKGACPKVLSGAGKILHRASTPAEEPPKVLVDV